MAAEHDDIATACAPKDRHAVAERLRAASVVAFETAYGSERRNDNVAAANRALLTRLDQARAAGWPWTVIESTLRHLYPRPL